MSDETQFDTSDERSACERKIDEIREIVAVVRSHAQILERHATTIGGIQRSIDALTGAIDVVVSHQREMNQLLAGIHSMYARLDCVRPKRRTPSSDVLVVGGGEEG